MDLVIDCNVLVDASGQGMEEYAQASLELLKYLLLIPEFRLVIDGKGKIAREYDNRINATMYARNWLEKLQRSQRVVQLNSLSVPKGARVKLLEERLHKRDFPLIETALAADHTIITRDFNSFQKEIITILRRQLNVYVLAADEYYANLRAAEVQAENQPAE
ncbi:MAG: hypothetical protein ACM3JB_15825 [Acidobacteriaceae bacterium]